MGHAVPDYVNPERKIMETVGDFYQQAVPRSVIVSKIESALQAKDPIAPRWGTQHIASMRLPCAPKFPIQ